MMSYENAPTAEQQLQLNLDVRLSFKTRRRSKGYIIVTFPTIRTAPYLKGRRWKDIRARAAVDVATGIKSPVAIGELALSLEFDNAVLGGVNSKNNVIRLAGRQ